MSFGLNRIVKNILPKRLFYRGLLIVAVPILILQITISLVFFDSLWIKTNKGLTKALVSEIVTIIDIYNNESQYNKKIVTDLYNKNFSFSVRFLENEKLPDIKVERWFSPMDRTLRRELKPKIGQHWFNTISYKEVVDLRIKFRDGVLQIFFPKERIQVSSIRIFAFWITVPAILMIAVAMIFLKNQTRPITKLAQASERFGRGEDVEEFRPSGALEIRKAGLEFEKMRKRILRHLNQRSEMLSGISQAAAVEALNGSQSFIKKRAKSFSNRRNFVVNYLNTIPGITCLVPKGAFYVFPSCKGLIGKKTKIKDDTDFVQKLLEKQNVAVVQGSAFGLDGYFRISYATSMQKLKVAMARIKLFCESLG